MACNTLARMCSVESVPLSRLKKTLSPFEISIVTRWLSGIGVCDVEVGVLIGAASSGRNVAVKIKKTSRRKNKSTIGVMSIRGVFTAILIFPIIFQLFFLQCLSKQNQKITSKLKQMSG